MHENSFLSSRVLRSSGQSTPEATAGDASLAGSGLGRGNPRWQMQQLGAAVVVLFAALSSTLSDELDSAEDCLSRAAEILHTVGADQPPPRQATKSGLAPWQIREVTAHIETNLDMPIKSSELAEVARLSPCHFSRVFRDSFGCSPLEYVMRRRIEHAQGLMLCAEAPLSQIALDCGFADQAHFSRTFRRIVGETPRSWRRARLSRAAPDSAAKLQPSAPARVAGTGAPTVSARWSSSLAAADVSGPPQQTPLLASRPAAVSARRR